MADVAGPTYRTFHSSGSFDRNELYYDDEDDDLEFEEWDPLDDE